MEITIEEGRMYKSNEKDLIKVININEKEDRIHLRNITYNYNYWTSLSKVKAGGILIEKI